MRRPSGLPESDQAAHDVARVEAAADALRANVVDGVEEEVARLMAEVDGLREAIDRNEKEIDGFVRQQMKECDDQ